MPNGRTRATASATFSGVNPPASRVLRAAATRAAALQSIVWPVPPRLTGSCASSRIVVAAGHASGAVSSVIALMTGAQILEA